MKTITVKTHNAQQVINEQNVVTQDGQTTIIEAVDNANYEFHDASIGHGPNHIISKRVDNDLHVSFERDGADSDLIIQNFYKDNANGVNNSALIGISEDGEYYYYIPDTGKVYDFVTQLEPGAIEGQALGGEDYITPWWLQTLPLIGAAGLLPFFIGRNDNDSDNNSDNDSPGPITAPAAPTVVITEDTNDDGVLSNGELEGTVGVLITVPDDAIVGDTLVITNPDGTKDTVTITEDIIDNGVVKEYPAPNDGDTIKVEAVIEDADGNQSPPSSDEAIIDSSGPIAEDDFKAAPTNTPVTINVLTNDSGDDIDPDSVTLIDPQTNQPTDSITIDGEGTWTLGDNPGEVVFTPESGFTSDPTPVSYTVKDVNGNVSNPAEISIDYEQTPPVATDDTQSGPIGESVIIDVVANDSDADNDLDPTSVQLIDADGNPASELVVPNEGTWTVDPATGQVTFTPIAGFTADPAPISYTVSDTTGLVSNPASISVDYPDIPALVSISGDDSVSEDAGNANYVIALDKASTTDTVVTYKVINRTTEDADFTGETTATVTIAAGDTSVAVKVGILDDDIFEQTEDFDVVITDVSEGTTIGPNDSVNTTIIDEDSNNNQVSDDKPVVDIIATDNEAVEGADDTLVFTVSQNNLSSVNTTVQVKLGEASTVSAADIATISYTNADGTTVNLTNPVDIQDFLDNGDSLTIAAGSTSAPPITVTVLDDNFYEVSENLVLEIDNAQNAVIGIDSATGVVTDNDAPPTISINDVTLNEQDGTMTFTLSVLGTTSEDISVNYATSDNSAIESTDYTPQSGTVTISANETSTTITVPIINDEIWEPTETFNVTLSNPINATIDDDNGIGVGTIINDDITAVNDSAIAVEGGGLDNSAESSVATGNVLDNDDPMTANDNVNTTVTSIRVGDEENAGKEGTVGSELVGTYGVLILNEDGTFTYEIDNTKSTVQALNDDDTRVDSFNYTMSDGTLMDTAVLDITIQGNNDASVITGATSVRVSEEGLPDAITDATGNSDTTNSQAASGTITFTDIDNTEVSDFTLELTGPSDIQVQGNEVTWLWDESTDTLTAQSNIEGNPTDIMTIAVGDITSNGTEYTATYDTTILQAIDHPSNNGEDELTLQFGAIVNDGDKSQSTEFTVAVEDDRPVVAQGLLEVPLGPVNTNVMILLDTSTSMSWNAAGGKGTDGESRFDVAKAAISNLIDGFAEVGDSRIQIVEGNSGARAQELWLTPEQAKIYINSLTASGGTNYDALLGTAITAFDASGALDNAQNYAYSFTDGLPSFGSGDIDSLEGDLNGDGFANDQIQSGDEGIQVVEEAMWTDFLASNSIKSYAFALGSEVTTDELTPIAYDGQLQSNNDAELATIVTDLDQLNSILLSALPEPAKTGDLVKGDLLVDAQAGFGADGGNVASITMDGTTYEYNPADGSSPSAITVSTGTDRSSYNAETATIIITTEAGAIMELNFETGKYNYQSTATINGYQESISFTVMDNDGDIISAERSLDIYRLVAVEDRLITNDLSSTLNIDQAVLLANDKVGANTEVSEGANANGGIVNGSEPFVFEFAADSQIQGSFEYSLSDGTKSDTASVSIQIEDNATITGTELSETLMGRADESDTLEGLAGDDILQGKSGNDTLTGGAGDDTFIWSVNDKGTAGSPDIDTITDFTEGNNLLQLHDLLQGETIGDIDSMENYVSWESATSTLHVSTTGDFTEGGVGTTTQSDLDIVLTGYSGSLTDLIDTFII